MADDFDPLHKWLGIPPSEQPPHCYRLLGLEPFEDNLDVIANAVDRQMAFLRGFQSGPHAALAQEVIEQIQVARLWLLRPERKAEYDAWLREQLAATAPPPPLDIAAPPTVENVAPAAEIPLSASSPPPRVSPAPSPPPVSEFPAVREVAADLEEILGGQDSFPPPPARPTRARRREKIGVAISWSAAAVAAVALVVVVWKIHQSWSPDGTLEVSWPEEEREGGTLFVEGKLVSLPPSGNIIVPLPGGPRQVRIQRPGFKPYELMVSVTPRQTTLVRPVWRALKEEVPDEASAGPGKAESDSPSEDPNIKRLKADTKSEEKT